MQEEEQRQQAKELLHLFVEQQVLQRLQQLLLMTVAVC
jgi:hypothetical protein